MIRWSIVLFVLLAAACAPNPRQERPIVGPTAAPATAAAAAPGDLPATLRRDVEALTRLGERTPRNEGSLAKAASFLERELKGAGLELRKERFNVERRGGATFENVIGDLPGTGAHEWIIVGAHYDTAWGTPGADDNASAVAVLLELARRLGKAAPAHPIRFVGFAAEEPPYFATADMGSLVHAKNCRFRGELVKAMIALETLGYYSDQPGSQRVPPGLGNLYPSVGDFLLVAGDGRSRTLAHAVTTGLRRAGSLPVEEIVLWQNAEGVLGLSDQRNFWHEGIPAVMVTDTAMMRNPTYHQPTDTPDTLDYEKLAQVTVALEAVVRELAEVPAAIVPASQER